MDVATGRKWLVSGAKRQKYKIKNKKRGTRRHLAQKGILQAVSGIHADADWGPNLRNYEDGMYEYVDTQWVLVCTY